MSVVYTTCPGCLARYRIERIDPVVVLDGGHLRCANCGTPVTAHQDFDQEYWYTLAAAFGFERTHAAAELVRMSYDLWDPMECGTFREFFTQLLEARQGGMQMRTVSGG